MLIKEECIFGLELYISVYMEVLFSLDLKRLAMP